MVRLVLNGPQRGTLWEDGRCSDTGITPFAPASPPGTCSGSTIRSDQADNDTDHPVPGYRQATHPVGIKLQIRRAGARYLRRSSSRSATPFPDVIERVALDSALTGLVCRLAAGGGHAWVWAASSAGPGLSCQPHM